MDWTKGAYKVVPSEGYSVNVVLIIATHGTPRLFNALCEIIKLWLSGLTGFTKNLTK